MSRSIALLVALLASFYAQSLLAQDIVLGQKYGHGVHAFFAGDYVKAYEQLTASIEGGTHDPRAYYFRGLAYLKLGRSQEATMDFRKGAELETRDLNRLYNVAKSLERVQGNARVELENYRVDARMAALEEAERIRKARYEAIEQEESRVVREEAIPAAPAKPASSQAKSDAEIGTEPSEESAEPDLFAAPAESPVVKPAAESPSKAKTGEKKTSVSSAIGKAVKASVAGKAVREKADAPDKAISGQEKALNKAVTKETKAVGKAIKENVAKPKAEKEEAGADAKKPAVEENAEDSDPFSAVPATEEDQPAATEDNASGADPASGTDTPAEEVDSQDAPAK